MTASPRSIASGRERERKLALTSSPVPRYTIHGRRSTMTFAAAAMTSAQRAIFDSVPVVPSISSAWSATGTREALRASSFSLEP